MEKHYWFADCILFV